MGAEKKLEIQQPVETNSLSEDAPNWKKKKLDRQKLLRAIRAKSFTETIRGAIRKEVKKREPTTEE